MIVQHYLDANSGGTDDILPRTSQEVNSIHKRLKLPTLRSCRYKQEAFERSMSKYKTYLQKVGTCILLVCKFMIDQIRKNKNYTNKLIKFSTTNLHGIFSGGVYLDRVEVKVKDHNINHIDVRLLKRPYHHNYSAEVNLITDHFLILVENASLYKGPALWRLRDIDLEDLIIAEIINLVHKYENELYNMISIFIEARNNSDTTISCNFIDEVDLDFFVDVIKIWMT